MSYVLSAVREEVEKNHQAWLQQGLQQGRQEGEYRKAIHIAKKMLAKRINSSLIKEITDLSDQDLLTLEE